MVSLERNVVLSIAGYDPSAGAGVLSDCKTLENCGCYGLGVLTSVTSQSSEKFTDLVWLDSERIKSQMDPLIESFDIKGIKIGLTAGYEMLSGILEMINKQLPGVPVLWDPVVKSSSGFEFFSEEDAKLLPSLLKEIDYITPNTVEATFLTKAGVAEQAANLLAKDCSGVITGIYTEDNDAVFDLVFENKTRKLVKGKSLSSQKHGSGCVFSSSLISGIAQGLSLEKSAAFAKSYTSSFLESSSSNIGLHQVKK